MCIRDRVGGQAVGAGQLTDGRAADQAVEAALAAGGGGQRRGAGHGQEADLAGAAADAPAQPAVQDDGGADAVAEPDEDEVVPPPGGAGPVLGPPGEVDLVLQDHLGAWQLAQGGEEVGVPGGQVAGGLEPAGGGVDQSGGADGDGVQVRDLGPAGGVEQDTHDPFGGGAVAGVVVGTGVLDHEVGGGQGPPGQVGDDQGDPAGADVEGGEVGAGGDQRVDPGVGAAPLLAAFAYDGDQAAAAEPVEQIGDGGPGEPGELAQLGRREGSLVEQQIERQAVVDRPGGARRGRARGGHGRTSFQSLSIRVPS